MKIPFVDLKAQYKSIKSDIDQSIENVINDLDDEKKLDFVPKYSIDYGIKEIIKAMKNKKFIKLNQSKDYFGNYKIMKLI